MRICDRCGRAFAPNKGIYGARIGVVDLHDHGYYDLNDVKYHDLCLDCRKRYMEFLNSFLNERFIVVSKEGEDDGR